MSLQADGRRLADARGQVVAMADTPELAASIAKAVNSVDRIADDLEELLIACGLDYARAFSPHEAFAEVIRQVRMIRKAFPNERASI